MLWALTWYQPPRPVGVVLVGAGYQQNLAVPHNSYGWQSLLDLADLESRTPHSPQTFAVKEGPRPLVEGFGWRDALQNVSEGAVLLFVSAHGGADREGPFLLPGDYSGERSQRRRLNELFDALADLPPEQHKLVCFDATQIASNWRLGILHNDFARALIALDEEIRSIDNLVVICASGIDEQSWVCDQWRRTVFAHYFLQGLGGGAADRDRNGRISAAELHHWLSTNVSVWATTHRGVTQTPLLLPLGEPGRRRARQIDLTTAATAGAAVDFQSLDSFSSPPQLHDAWRRYEEMLEQSPPGFAYAPAYWREYIATLLRYEELLAAGDSAHAAQMHERLSGIEYRMQRERPQSQASMQNSLSIYKVAGAAEPPRDAALSVLNELWNAPDNQHASIWQAALSAAGRQSDQQHLLRIAVFEALLQRAIEDPAGNLARASALVGVVDSPLYPLPAEIHFLLMLQRHLPEGALAEQSGRRISAALTLRQLAERAAVAHQGGSAQAAEQILPWIEDQVKQADEQRRLGEDLLFAGPEDRSEADAYFARAKSGYQQALDAAEKVQSAVAARDLVLAKLPYYSQWLAEATLDPYVADPRHEDMLQAAEELWRQSHRLVDMLERPDPRWIVRTPPPTSEQPQPRSLIDQRKTVVLAFDELTRSHHQQAVAMANGESPAHWRAAQRVLRVPHHDWRSRLKVMARSRDMMRRSLAEQQVEQARLAASAEDESQPASADDLRRRAMAASRWHGRLALAELGRDVFALSQADAGDTFDQVRHRLDVFEVEQSWWTSVLAAGDELHVRFSALPRRIDEPLKKTDGSDSPQRRQALVTAARLVRLIDGAQAQQLTIQPAALLRRLQSHDLAVFLAQRTLDDHWSGLEPGSEPYFRRAALAYLNDAQRLNPQSSAVGQCRDRINAAGGLQFAPLAPLNLTTQQRVRLDFQLQASQGKEFAAGFPVSWLSSGDGLTLVDPAAGQRIVRRFDAKQQGGAVAFTIDSPPLDAAERQPPLDVALAETKLTVHGFFRGQVLQAEAPVRLHLRPEIAAVRHPRPDAAAVSLSTTDEIHRRFGEGNGAVALVLDCSGSMGPPEGSDSAAGSKYAEAVSALREVLQKIPPGTQISLWTFGQAIGPERTTVAAESTIRRVQEPIVWNPRDAAQLASLMAKIDPAHVQPWNESPIVRTILAAKGDVEDAAGFRTILVITDGLDNRFAHDLIANPGGKSIPDVLTAAFAGSCIALNVVGFKVVGGEEAKVQQQFSVVERLSPPGRFYRVSQTEYLADTLATALRRRLRFEVDAFDGQPASSPLELGHAGGSDVWPLKPLAPGVYQLRTDPGRPVRAEVALNRGDVLALALQSGRDGLELRRRAYSVEMFPNQPFAEQNGWRATVMQNQLAAHRELRGAIALEQISASASSLLSQITPRTIWLEAYSQPTAQPGLSWRPMLGFPMPVWSLSAAGWPAQSDGRGSQPPALHVWWSTDQTAPYAAALKRDASHKSIDDLSGAVIRAADETVRVESVSVEQHFVESTPGRREEQPCLVVRLQYSPGKVYWSELIGMETAGAEQRFYPSIGCYTGLFWPVTADEASRALEGIAVVSLEAFKRDAERRGNVIKFNDLPAPDANDVLPAPAYSFD